MVKYVIAGVGLVALAAVPPSPVLAQATPNIFVDLSVIEDGGRASGLPGIGGGNLAIPPSKAPVSTLHVAPKMQTKLRAPAPRKTMAPATTPAAKPAAPKPAPAEKQMAKAEPKPEPKPAPAPKPVAAPAPPAAPKPAVETAAAPPPPPPPAAPAAPTAETSSPAPPPPPAVSATPPPTAAPSAAGPATETASAPVSFEIKPGRALRIAFGDTETKLPDADKANLQTLASAMRDKKDFRLQLLAYAGGTDLSTSRARRLSLSRALSVRSFLIDNGIRSTQIDVRALGNKTSETPVNRVDLNLARR